MTQSIVLFVLILLVALRPLVAESYDSAQSNLTAALGAVSDPSPLATLVFNVLILASALALTVLRWRGRIGAYRKTGLEAGTALILIASIVSCFVASNKRLAINASIDWLCYPVLAITLVQILTHRWQRNILLAVILASACAQSANCLWDHFYGFDDTWDHYVSQKEDLWARQGVPLDSPKVELFERRMQAREAQGYLPHSNVTGSYLVLCGFAALSLAVARWRRRAEVGWVRLVGPAIGVCILAAAVSLTKSTGAVVSAVVGLALWLVVTVCRKWIDAHRGKAFLLGWACVAAGAFAVAGHGMYHGTLPGASLNFRWQYWTTSADMIADHGLTGVGRENLGRHYLQYKPIEAPEEVSNPHNLFVQAIAEWGIIGLVGLVVMLAGVSRTVTRPILPEPSGGGASSEHVPRGPALVWAAAVGCAMLAARIPLAGITDPDFLYYTTVTMGLAWGIGFWLFAPTANEERNVWLSGGIAIGLFAFMLHDMINFATFVPGTATTLFALLAICIAERLPGPAEALGDAPTRRPWPAVLSAAMTLGVVVFAVLPVARSAHHVDRATTLAGLLGQGPTTVDSVDRQFTAADDTDPLDPTACAMRAAWWFAVAEAAPPLRDRAFATAAASAAEAARRDPKSISLARLLAQIHTAKAAHTGLLDDHLTAFNLTGQVLRLYPTDPAGHVAAAQSHLCVAETMKAKGGEAGGRDHLRAAVASYRRALELDDARPDWEVIRGLRDHERRRIEEEIRRAEAQLGDAP